MFYVYEVKEEDWLVYGTSTADGSCTAAVKQSKLRLRSYDEKRDSGISLHFVVGYSSYGGLSPWLE